MSAVHIITTARKRFTQEIEAASLSVDIDGFKRFVTKLDRPPAGAGIDEKILPAFFVYSNSERNAPVGSETDQRDLFVDVLIAARDFGDPQDQLDPIQLQIEAAIIASQNLSGLCQEVAFESAEISQEQGRINFAARTLSFRLTISVTRSDPST